MTTLTVEELDKISSLLGYNPQTGVFWWKHQPNGRVPLFSSPGTVNGAYLKIQVAGKKTGAHRLAWFLANGEWPKGQIDHIDGDTLNNRLSNLRDATHSENARNRSGPDRDSASGHRGVYWHKGRGKWAAAIRHHGQHISLGLHDSIEDAIAERKAAEKALWSKEDCGGQW